MKPLQCQVSSHPAEIELVGSKFCRLEASLDEVDRQLTVSWAAITSDESACDENWPLVDTEAQKCQDLEEVLDEV